MKGTSRGRVIICVAGLVIALIGCSGESASPTPGQPLPGPFTAESIQDAVELLASGGIPVRVRPSDAPLVSVDQPSRVGLLRFQVRNLALELNTGGGMLGSELDAYAAAAGAPPMAPLILGWARTADLEAARAAASLLTDALETDPADVVIPGLVSALFVADVVGPTAGPAARPAADPAPRRLALAGPLFAADADFCSDVSRYLAAVLEDVLDPSISLEPEWLADAIDLYAGIENDEDRLRSAVGALAMLVYATSISRPWGATLSAVPTAVHYQVGDDLTVQAKAFHINVAIGEGALAEEAAECAALADADLTGGGDAEGVPVIWVLPELQPHTSDVSGDLELEERGQVASAALEYETKAETAEAHRTGTLRTAIARVTGIIHRQEIGEVEYAVGELLTGGQLGVAAPTVAATYARLAPALRDLLYPRAYASVEVSWHAGPDESPSPTPEPTPDEPDESPDETPDETPDKTPDDDDPCATSCAMSNGDPHIVTVDGSGYDFQAAGEFVLLRSADGSFELQARQEPYGTSDTVTINTAIAMRVGAHRVGIYLNPTDFSLAARVDGSPLEADGPTDLDGALIERDGTGYAVTFGDGTKLFAISQDGYGINILLAPSQLLAGSGVGLMGPVPAGERRLPALPDGSIVEQGFSRADYHQAVYVTFADAWRVTDAGSLFDYDGGATTATFVLPGHPSEGNVVRLEDLTPEQRAAGEQACAGITDQLLHDQCVFDVGITGDGGFSESYDASAQLIETGSLTPSGERARVVNLYANDTGPVALDVYAWSGDASDAGESAAALVATVAFGAASPWFNPGAMPSGFGYPVNRISIQRQGEPLNAFQFNLEDLQRDAQPGAERTLVISTDDPEQLSIVGGRPASLLELYEESPVGFPLPDAPVGQALLFVDSSGLQHTLPEARFFASAGNGCLTQPDFPTLAEMIGPFRFDPRHLALPPGQHDLTLHTASGQEDPFTFRCDTPPAIPPIPFTVAAGERLYLFLYATPKDTQIKAMLLPLGG